METDSKTIAKQFADALTSRRWNDLADLMHDDMVYTVMGYDLPGAGSLSKAEMLAALPDLLSMFADDSPRLHVLRMIAEGEWVVVEAEGVGSLADGRPYVNRYAHVIEIVDGRVRTFNEYMDTQHMSLLMSAGALSSE